MHIEDLFLLPVCILLRWQVALDERPGHSLLPYRYQDEQEASDKQLSAPGVGQVEALLVCLLLVSLGDLMETKRLRSLTRNHRS